MIFFSLSQMTFADIIQNRYGVPDTETDKE